MPLDPKNVSTDIDLDKLLAQMQCACCGKPALQCATFFPSKELCGQCNPSTSHLDLSDVVLAPRSGSVDVLDKEGADRE